MSPEPGARAAYRLGVPRSPLALRCSPRAGSTRGTYAALSEVAQRTETEERRRVFFHMRLVGSQGFVMRQMTPANRTEKPDEGSTRREGPYHNATYFWEYPTLRRSIVPRVIRSRSRMIEDTSLA
jgi:hypothetical protein